MLCIVLLTSIVTAFAADEDFAFSLTVPKGNTTMWIDTRTSNQKLYAGNDGTAKCSTTNAPGYGYYICLANTKNNVMATVGEWLGYSGAKKYLSYYSGHNAVNDYYWAAGRPDHDYAGTYSIEGKYNADKT